MQVGSPRGQAGMVGGVGWRKPAASCSQTPAWSHAVAAQMSSSASVTVNIYHPWPPGLPNEPKLQSPLILLNAAQLFIAPPNRHFWPAASLAAEQGFSRQTEQGHVFFQFVHGDHYGDNLCVERG